ncbi:phosphoribosylanthranilate isomerase [Neobacillus jeddahensis]|uniref:phosphoribosylanthranilate isomerase n=1 Tax=Neobacillus jeddahensis TaxID=1461580 RepID=UPI00058B6D6C|nr:phosphoribosylanthranilate isomerase [Neobacillus jeddahensis]
MKVKICGITDVSTAQAAVKLGADAIGLVFADSKRKVSLDRAKEIVLALPSEVKKIGVFVNENSKEMERIASYVGLTHLQLHGDESAIYCESLSLPVIKAISFQGNKVLAAMQSFPADYILLDGPKGKYHGGNGTAFNWSEVQTAYLNGKKLILAGGLHVENVEEAISIMNPYMVDVSSGVETNGVKDLVKIEAFINKVKTRKVGGE